MKPITYRPMLSKDEMLFLIDKLAGSKPIDWFDEQETKRLMNKFQMALAMKAFKQRMKDGQNE